MSNHIDHIEITNFKSIRHQKIEGCKRINVFIGYPNVGKSNILEAISALSYLQKDFTEPYSKLCRFKNASELFFDANFNEKITIKYAKNIDIEFEYVNESNLNFSVTELVEETDGIARVEYKRLGFSENKVHFYQLNANKDIFKLKKYHFLNSYYYPNLLTQHKTNGLFLFSPFGENLVDVVQSKKDLRKVVSGLFKEYHLKLSIDQGNNSMKALKQLDDDTIFLIPFYQMADTLQRLIFHKAAIMSNENTVLLFEEPEAHMFPPYIRKFTGDIIFNKENGNQYFISTHSPFVIDDLMEDAREDLAVFLVGLKDGETVIKRLSDEELEEVHKLHVDLFFNIESYLD